MLPEIRDQLKGALGASVTGGGYVLSSDRIRLGYVPLEESNEFLSTIIEDGPFLLIRGGEMTRFERVGAVQKPEYMITATLWIGLSKEKADELRNAEALVEEIYNLWRDNSLWVTTGVPPPQEMAFSPPEILLSVSPAVAKWDYSLRFMGCIGMK
jgi:hypothetical protein